MTRLAPISRDTLGAEEQALWDRITAVRSMKGPTGILMHVPALLEHVEALGDYFRFNAALPPADRELVILATVREAGAQYAWARHEPGANRAGTRPEAIDVVRAHGGLDGLTPRERTLVEIARSLLREHALSDALYARATAELSTRELVETVTLVGHYTCIGFLIKGFDVPHPGDAPSF